MNGADLLKRCIASKPSEAKRKEADAVLEAMGCALRYGGENHLIASHPDFCDHSQFRNGMLAVNCHYNGRQGAVHPMAIADIIKAAKYLEKKK